MSVINKPLIIKIKEIWSYLKKIGIKIAKEIIGVKLGGWGKNLEIKIIPRAYKNVKFPLKYFLLIFILFWLSKYIIFFVL